MRNFLESYLTHSTTDNYQYLITCDELLEIDEDPLEMIGCEPEGREGQLDWQLLERYNQLAKAKEQEMI